VPMLDYDNDNDCGNAIARSLVRDALAFALPRQVPGGPAIGIEKVQKLTMKWVRMLAT